MEKSFRYFEFAVVFFCSEIIGLDLLSQHETILLRFCGRKTQLDVSNLAAIAENNDARPIVIDLPKIFSNKVYKARTIATKSRHSNKEDFEFMQNEILELLSKGIVRRSTSPWRAQAFVVKRQKRRIVIDYSMTVILLTSRDAYPFPNMQKLQNTLVFKNVWSEYK